jgi:hypothetical protein
MKRPVLMISRTSNLTVFRKLQEPKQAEDKKDCTDNGSLAFTSTAPTPQPCK